MRPAIVRHVLLGDADVEVLALGSAFSSRSRPVPVAIAAVDPHNRGRCSQSFTQGLGRTPCCSSEASALLDGEGLARF